MAKKAHNNIDWKKPPKKVLRGMYVEKGMSIKQIAKTLGISTSPVNRWLEQDGIEKRTLSEQKKLLHLHGENNPFFGKKHSRETRNKISKAREKLTDEECMNLARDYVYFNDPFEELKRKYQVSNLEHYMNRAIDLGTISKEEYHESYSRKMREQNIGLNLGKGSISIEDRDKIISLVKREIEAFKKGKLKKFTTNVELAEKCGDDKNNSKKISSCVCRSDIPIEDRDLRKTVLRSRKGGKHNKEAIEKMRAAHIGRVVSEEQKEKIRKTMLSEENYPKFIENGIRSAKVGRRMKYLLRGNYFDSKEEAATASLLEKYIPGYKLVEGRNFQANGDTRCIYDFVLPQAIVEWHPIQIRFDASKEDKEAYKELVKELPIKERKDFEKWYRQELAVDYWMRRQEASDNSRIYNGKEVILARNFNELYDLVLSKYGRNMPSKSELRREFKRYKQETTKYRQEQEAA